jgi:hypothetical protein
MYDIKRLSGESLASKLTIGLIILAVFGIQLIFL